MKEERKLQPTNQLCQQLLQPKMDICIYDSDALLYLQSRTHCFGVYGVHSKEKSCYQSWPHLTENHTTQLDIQVAHCTMQEYIHQMVAHGLQLMQQVVQPERGHAQRTVRFVAGVRTNWLSPEIVPQQLNPRCLTCDVAIFHDCRLIVEAETAVQRVGVDNHANRCT